MRTAAARQSNKIGVRSFRFMNAAEPPNFCIKVRKCRSKASHVKPIVNAGEGDTVGEKFGDGNRHRDCYERWKDESRHSAEQAVQSVNIQQREWNHRTGHQATLKKVRPLPRRIDTASEIKLKREKTEKSDSGDETGYSNPKCAPLRFAGICGLLSQQRNNGHEKEAERGYDIKHVHPFPADGTSMPHKFSAPETGDQFRKERPESRKSENWMRPPVRKWFRSPAE